MNASVARQSGDSDISVTGGSALTFTGGAGGNWGTPQTVTLAAAEDSNAANGSATIRVSATGIPNADVTATESDNDSLNFVLTPNTISVPEGGSNTFTVALSADPVTDVNASVTRVSGDTDIVASPVSLNFTAGAAGNWSVPQQVTVNANEDPDAGNGTATIRLSAIGLENADVIATEQDNETLNIVTNRDAVTVPEGGSDSTLQVRLNADPVTNVTVSIARVSGDTDISVSTTTLTFTGGPPPGGNWATFKTVTIQADEDDLDVINGTATIRLSAAGIAPKDISATEVDNDTLNFVTNPTSVTVPEGGTANFNVTLDKEPAATVTATVSNVSGDTDITVQSGGTLTFDSTNWNTPHPVTLAAAEDDLDLINGTAIIRVSSAANIPNKDVTATEEDNEVLNFRTDTDFVTVPEGSSATFGVRLNAQPEGTTTVTATVFSISSATEPDIIVDAASSTLTFDATNWDSFQQVLLVALEDNDDLAGTATIQISASGIPTREVTATEEDDDSITIIAPNGPEFWIMGTSRLIRWNFTPDLPPSVNIELFLNGFFERTIAINTANDGNFTWDIPTTLVVDSAYTVRVIAAAPFNVSDESDAEFSILDTGSDTDGDAIPDFEERGPTGLDDMYDGNQFGGPDWNESTAASLFSFDGSRYVTFEASGDISNMQALEPPAGAPAEVMFPYGIFSFQIDVASDGAPATVTMFFSDNDETPDTYWKEGERPGIPFEWYEFFDDGETGAQIDGINNTVTLFFVDGSRGDDDVTANGIISDPGGPGVTAPPPPEEGGSDCFIATAAYGSPAAPHVQILREFRDSYLLTNRAGRWFVVQYYRYSPPAASWLAKHPMAKAGVRILLTPLVILAWALKHAPFAFPMMAVLCISGFAMRRTRKRYAQD